MAGRLSRQAPSRLTRGGVRPSLWAGLGCASAALLTCPVRPAMVIGHSMDPTLHSGQVLLIDKRQARSNRVQAGEIVAFRSDGMCQIKRVYAVEGETVWEVHSPDTPQVVLLADPSTAAGVPWKRRMIRQLGSYLVPVRVPAGHVYLLGDHANASVDSRSYGPVPCSAILGRARLRCSGQNLAVRNATVWLSRRRHRT